MADHHPDRTALERFLGGTLTERESRELQHHLFLCPDCEERLLALLPAGSSPSPAPLPGEEYQRLLRGLLAGYPAEAGAHRNRLAGERAAAPVLWREIAALSPARRRGRVRRDLRLHTWGFHEHLLEQARRETLADLSAGEELLRLARDVAERLDPHAYGPGAVAAAQARTWASLGNLLRVRGDFPRSEKAFHTAERHLARSWLDPLDEAFLLELKAPLRRAQRRFAEALELIDGALAIYREVNEPQLQGRALTVKGVVLQYQGEPMAAAACFERSLALLDPFREPRLPAMAWYNRIGCLLEAGRSDEAAALIPEARRLMEEVGVPADRWRLRWSEGRIALSLGRFEKAEEALREARGAFVEAGLAFDAALVSLDLALVYLRQRRGEETRRLAAETIPVFRSREVGREALAALLVFQQAAEVEQITTGLLAEIAAYLRQARENPRLRFRDGGS